MTSGRPETESPWAMGMRVAVEAVGEHPKPFALQGDAGWWDEVSSALKVPETRLLGALRLDLEGYRVGRRLLFRGRFAASIEVACAFCLERFAQGFDEPFQLLLEPLDETSESASESIALDPDDPEFGRYCGDELDFAPAVFEALALAWPLQPRCSESCGGLCPACGKNRNLEPCGCQNHSESGPFADLAERLARARSS